MIYKFSKYSILIDKSKPIIYDGSRYIERFKPINDILYSLSKREKSTLVFISIWMTSNFKPYWYTLSTLKRIIKSTLIEIHSLIEPWFRFFWINPTIIIFVFSRILHFASDTIHSEDYLEKALTTSDF